jgi:hypothetical protein
VSRTCDEPVELIISNTSEKPEESTRSRTSNEPAEVTITIPDDEPAEEMIQSNPTSGTTSREKIYMLCAGLVLFIGWLFLVWFFSLAVKVLLNGIRST